VAALDKYAHHTYSVAWIDCLAQGKKLGRSILMLGEHAVFDELPKPLRKTPLTVHKDQKWKVPFDMPDFLLSQSATAVFNSLHYSFKKSFFKNSIVHYDSFFYPLDFIGAWNKLYGQKGFLQYQFVLPLDK